MKVIVLLTFALLVLIALAEIEQRNRGPSKTGNFVNNLRQKSPTGRVGTPQGKNISLSNTSPNPGCLSICQKYSHLGCQGKSNCKPGTFEAEKGMVMLFVNAIVAQLFVDPDTKNFFNGKFNDVNFLTDKNSKSILMDKQYRFNGGLKGFHCPTFAKNGMNDVGVVASMTDIHDWTSNGRKGKKKLNKLSFDAHNRINIDVLAQFGLDPVDLYAVAKGLDNFRTGQGDKNEVACFDNDCNPTSNYVITVHDNYFSPPYLSVPSHSKITFRNDASNSVNNTIIPGTGLFQCVQKGSQVIRIGPGKPSTVTLGQGNGSFFFFSDDKCNSTALAGRIDIFKDVNQATPNPTICH